MFTKFPQVKTCNVYVKVRPIFEMFSLNVFLSQQSYCPFKTMKGCRLNLHLRSILMGQCMLSDPAHDPDTSLNHFYNPFEQVGNEFQPLKHALLNLYTQA